MIDLDATDHKILNLLQADGRITNAELAERVNLSQSACSRRVRRLESEGVIEGYAALVDHSAVGRPATVFVEITLNSQQRQTLDAFEAAVREYPAVMFCCFMSGDADYFLELAAADTADYERIYRTYLSQFPGVARIRSSFAPRAVCKTTALRLP